MNKNRLEFAGISLELPTGWSDVTDDLDDGGLLTLRKKSGALGALQLAVRLNESEKSARFDMDRLTTILNVYSAKNELGTARNIKKCNEGILSISGEFVFSDEFVRIWYITDSNNLAMITYSSTLPDDPLLPSEVAEADLIVTSIIF